MGNDRLLLTDESGNAMLLRNYSVERTAAFSVGAAIRKASISRDDVFLATVDSENTVQLWNTETGALSSTLPELTAVVNNIRFSSDGTRLAVIMKNLVNVYLTNPKNLLTLAESRLPANLR